MSAGSGPTTTSQFVLEWLRRAILAGELRPTDRVAQEDVAARIGVSIAPVREALRVLEQEGQVTYLPRRGYFVTELHVADLVEIYELRQLLEAQAVRRALPSFDADSLDRLMLAAKDCADAAEEGDIAAELDANRRFHFAILDTPERPHTGRLIRLLWDATDAYRALYYNSREERQATIEAHDRIIEAIRRGDEERLLAELDAHRQRALDVLLGILDTG